MKGSSGLIVARPIVPAASLDAEPVKVGAEKADVATRDGRLAFSK
jgi:hypothetical protein